MSFTSWLQNRRRGQRHHERQGSLRAASHRLSLEALEDRLTPSFYQYGDIPYDQVAGFTYNYPSVTTDFNDDALPDLFAVTIPGTGENGAIGSVYLNRGDGTYDLTQWFGVGVDPRLVGTGDFNGDGRPDLAVYNYYSESDQPVSIFLNDGIWPNTAQLSIGSASVTEGNSGTAAAVFTVTLENGPDQPVTLQFATSEGSATAGADYQTTAGTLTFAPGETTKTISVLVVGDRLAEGNESFFVDLSAPTNAVLAHDRAWGVILDDEPGVSIADASVTEGNTGTRSASFTVTLSVIYDMPVTMNYATANGTATAGSDYQAASGTLTFAPGETSKTLNVTVNGDRLAEPNETFVVNMSNPTNATIVDGQGVGTIVDDEPRISISDVTKYEGTTHGNSKNTTLFTFTVTLSAAYDQAVTMSFQTMDGTATTSDGDYVGKTGTLTFAPGETMKTITIEVKGDSKMEATEYFYLDLFGNSSNSLFTKSPGIGTILNDD